MLIILSAVLLLASPGEPEIHEEQGTGSMDVLFFQYRLVMRDLLGRSCIYTPSCSHFGQEAILEKGPLVGTMVALERWTRCHSGSAGSGEYADGPGPTVIDPVSPGMEVTSWGLSLLPF